MSSHSKSVVAGENLNQDIESTDQAKNKRVDNLRVRPQIRMGGLFI